MGDRIDHFVNIEIQGGHVPGGTHVTLDITNGGIPTPLPGSVPTHRVKTDFENGRSDRPKLPMVFVFDDRRCVLTFEWQMFFVACNYTMVANNISRMWDDNVAFCNNTGFHGSHNRRNYILMEDLNNELPQTDKTRTCGDALLIYKDGKVLCFDGTVNPPLKPGAVHPANTNEAYTSIDRYLYNPRDNRAYFFPATVTGTDFHAHPWPMQAGTGLYPWWKNGTEPVAWMFHLAPGADISYPPKQTTGNTPVLEPL